MLLLLPAQLDQGQTLPDQPSGPLGWRDICKQGKATDVTYLDCCKASDSLPKQTVSSLNWSNMNLMDWLFCE